MGTAVDGGDKSIEVFDLPESEDILSPSELDATKLYQKFREVMLTGRIGLKRPQNQAALPLLPLLLRTKAGSPSLVPG